MIACLSALVAAGCLHNCKHSLHSAPLTMPAAVPALPSCLTTTLQNLDRSSVCYDQNASVVVQITDLCKCYYPENAYSNKRWWELCCTPQCMSSIAPEVYAVIKRGTSNAAAADCHSCPCCTPLLTGAAVTCGTWTCRTGPLRR